MNAIHQSLQQRLLVEFGQTGALQIEEEKGRGKIGKRHAGRDKVFALAVGLQMVLQHVQLGRQCGAGPVLASACLSLSRPFRSAILKDP